MLLQFPDQCVGIGESSNDLRPLLFFDTFRLCQVLEDIDQQVVRRGSRTGGITFESELEFLGEDGDGSNAHLTVDEDPARSPLNDNLGLW